ncbi:hypothetical protein KC19_3G010700 [Ceratodon purpureus]|uniref:Uncharacterized protein n=1 Tax=Ceratodon purpureus TaxID=3225 RepID=A0A8T0IEL2_CERPU|nr:hypothetical protein KC19_3G010700 [Ceratodon purpureus]
MDSDKSSLGKSSKVSQVSRPGRRTSTPSARPSTTPATSSGLQRWQYAMGLPVDGVADVGQWAIDVGLAHADGDDKRGAKRTKTTEHEKWTGTTFRIPDDGVPSDDGGETSSRGDDGEDQEGAGEDHEGAGE